jgi:hypothetical protein
MASYTVRINYREFQKNFNPEMKTSEFFKHVDEYGMVEIQYHYGPVVNMITEICWRFPNGGDFQKVRYGHSSPFAEWWCALTDETEEAEEWHSSDEDSEDIMASVTKGARECGATQDNAVKAIDALREMCKANPSLIEVTKKSE